MTKEELRTQYIGQGWQVDPITVTENDADGNPVTRPVWRKVSEVDGLVKYDVNVVSPKKVFGTAQVVVANDGEAGEDAEPLGFWKQEEVDFVGALRAHLATLEANAQVFSIAVKEVYNPDEVAVCTAYMENGSTKNYVLKRRNNTFSHKELI